MIGQIKISNPFLYCYRFLPLALHEPGTRRKKTLLCQRQIQNPKLSSAIACIVFYVLLCICCCLYVQGAHILTHLQ